MLDIDNCLCYQNYLPQNCSIHHTFGIADETDVSAEITEVVRVVHKNSGFHDLDLKPVVSQRVAGSW